ncbi:chromosome segregation protein SMC [Anaerobutyricum hallii]|uniref:chromosome segregation protein SMC n=1 Tax=Anaerobutyricum hallii TaxID=39488 RepID=UPI0039A0E6C0
MYLKSIEINGFKSFANKIVFEFPQGITGIVGPNGSGKSNIGDAVRWVLGEQSARQLRGSKMEDVIFSGTQSRRPMGFAYVAITFENANRIIPLDYEEVTVARRVYRSGESEYLINGSSCRRRDIVELFYDTGIGKEGYSIIGQGQVEKILSGKIEDSRELFDEAAGIAKYKKNRTVTEKSLEQERQNLERVTDILAELEKQVGPLEKQSAKAKEYLKLRDEEKDIDIHLFLYDYERLKKEQEENERQYKIVSGDLEDTRKTYEKIKEKNGKLQDQTQAVTESLETKESEKEELRRKKETKDNEILLLSHKVESNTLLITHYEELEKQSDEEKDTKTAEIEVLKKETVQKKQEISDGQKKLEELEESILTRRKEQESCEKKISGENDRLFSIMNTSSDTKEKLSRYAAMEEQLEIRNAEYNSRYISFNSELKEYNETAEELLKQQDAAKEAFEKQENLYQELEKREKHLQEKEQKYQDEMGNLNQEYLRTKSRYETLMNITERYDGYNQSIRRIMEQKNANPGIIGVVADILALPEKYETAIEIALGGALQNIVTEDNETAKKMINFLKKNRFGRATFLPLTNIRRRNSTISPSVLQDEGVIGIASTLVKVEERFQALVDSLLGRTVVVDTVDHALSLSRKNNFSLRLVTLDGELLNPGGAITGGAFRHSGNLLGRKREIEECKDSLRKAKAAWEERKEALSELKAGQQKLEEQKQQRKAKLDAASLLLHDLSNQIPDMDAKKEELSERITSLKEEHQILKEQIDEIRSQKEALLKEQRQ